MCCVLIVTFGMTTSLDTLYKTKRMSSSHLVAEQHDDHILLSILMNFSQPGLYMGGGGGGGERFKKEISQ